MATIFNSCGESVAYNPKQDIGASKGYGKFQVFNSLENPIPKEISDTDEIQEFFRKYRFIPYAGTNLNSGHSLLAWYELLYSLSPTNSSCINKKAAFAFGSIPTAGFAIDPNFDTGEELKEVGIAARSAYRDNLYKYVLFDRPIREFHRVIAKHYQKNGNGWIKLKISESIGEKRASLTIHRQENVLFVEPKDGQKTSKDMVALSPIWTDEYLRKNPPEFVAVYPRFNRSADGSLTTMFHLKSGDTDWYGRPQSSGSDLSKYGEVQNVFYRVRSAYGDFTGRLILEMEDHDPKTVMDDKDQDDSAGGYISEQHRFEQEFTNRGGDPQSVHISWRPYGARPMFVFAVPPNTSHEYFSTIKKMDQEDILRSHECTMRFMSFDVASGFSTDVFLSDYVLYVEPVIKDLRNTVIGFVNQALNVVWEMVGQQSMSIYSLEFASPISSDVKTYKEGLETKNMPVNDPKDDTQPKNVNVVNNTGKK